MRLEDLVEIGAARSQDAAAVFEPSGAFVSYLSLSDWMTDVAAALAAVGVVPGDRVGLCAPKTIAAVASLLGAMKAGGAYVPVDVSAPAARNGFIFNDCSCRAVIADKSVVDALNAELTGGPWRQAPFPGGPAGHEHNLVLLVRPESEPCAPADTELAYILYTSGSTGKPKGVMHTHATAFAFVDWCSDEFQPRADDRFSSHAPFHFDLSILDLYVPLKHGAAVVLIGAEPGKQPGVLADIIADRGITIWYSTPSILRMLVEYGKLEERDYSKLRIVLFAGEVFPIKHLRALMRCWPGKAYYNLYGPTETNVCTYAIAPDPLPEEREAPLPIGRKCSADETRVVEADGATVKRGEEGELVIAGGSVMIGYWNLPERNAQAFFEIDGARWYKTGDVVREESEGVYTFLGRRDRMIKRRGYRVELGEIEAALHRHPAISEAAAIAKADGDGETKVHVFYTWADEKPPSIVALKQFCARNLPLYMSPDRFTLVATMPKTSTDKIDYQRLQENG